MLYNPNNANHVVIYGKNHVIFLQYEGKGRVVKKNGIFGSVDKPKIVTCAAFTPNGDLLTGDSNGTIIGWQQNSNHSNFCITNVHKGATMSSLGPLQSAENTFAEKFLCVFSADHAFKLTFGHFLTVVLPENAVKYVQRVDGT